MEIKSTITILAFAPTCETEQGACPDTKERRLDYSKSLDHAVDPDGIGWICMTMNASLTLARRSNLGKETYQKWQSTWVGRTISRVAERRRHGDDQHILLYSS